MKKIKSYLAYSSIAKIILAVIVFSLGSLVANAQSNTSPEAIDLNELEVKKGDSQGIKYGDVAEKMVNAFGKPDSSAPYFFEMENQTGSLFIYDDNEIYFLKNKMDGFVLKSGKILVGKNDTYIKVGDPVSKVGEIYTGFRQEDGYVRIPIAIDGVLWDGALIVDFDATNKLITRILLHFD